MEENFPSPDDFERMLLVLSKCMNALGQLAAPKAWESSQKHVETKELKQGIIDTLNETIGALEKSQSTIEFVTGPIDRDSAMVLLQDMLERTLKWKDGPVPSELVDKARSGLELFGVPEPEKGGWDSYNPEDV